MTIRSRSREKNVGRTSVFCRAEAPCTSNERCTNLGDAKAPAGKYFENLPDRTTSLYNYTPKYEYLNSLNKDNYINI